MCGRVGAWCLSCSPHDSFMFHEANGWQPPEDRHKASTSALPLPLFLQMRNDVSGHTITGSGYQQSFGYTSKAGEIEMTRSTEEVFKAHLRERERGDLESDISCGTQEQAGSEGRYA